MRGYLVNQVIWKGWQVVVQSPKPREMEEERGEKRRSETRERRKAERQAVGLWLA